MPLPGGVCPLVEIVQAVTIPETAVDLEFGPIASEGDGVGPIGLQLDRTGPGLLGGGHDGQCTLQVAVVVGRQLGDHKGSLCRADGLMGDLHLCSD